MNSLNHVAKDHSIQAMYKTLPYTVNLGQLEGHIGGALKIWLGFSCRVRSGQKERQHEDFLGIYSGAVLDIVLKSGNTRLSRLLLSLGKSPLSSRQGYTKVETRKENVEARYFDEVLTRKN